jgi:COMPASS component SWD1
MSRSLNLPTGLMIPSTERRGMQCHIAQTESGLREVCTRNETDPRRPAIEPVAWAEGAADPAAHKIYIWDISNDGQFASALDGGREPLIHIHVSAVVFHAGS